MPSRLTRRTVLCASVTVAAMGSAGDSFAAAPGRFGSNLFAFEGAGAGNLVFAVIISVPGTGSAAPARVGFEVVLHAGGRRWTIKIPRPLHTVSISERPDGRVFTGEILGPRMDAAATYSAIVVEIPRPFVAAGQSMAIWSEVRSAAGARFRMGSPFLAELVARDGNLCRLYHAASPSDDRALLTDAVVARIATMAAASGVAADPALHARRLATRILPDTLHYHPDLPVGFSFACQNGRHPADNVEAVTVTVLTGAATPRLSSTPFPLKSTFPYFVPLDLAA